MYKIKVFLQNTIFLALCFLLPLNAYAGTMNPSTGDDTGRNMWIVIVVAAVALIALVVTALMGKKSGKK